jgi:MFS family permease
MKAVLLCAVALVMVAQLALGEVHPTLAALSIALLVYFLGFNVLEASQPSLVSKYAPGVRKGAAMGVYNTTQALGLFAGGAGGGWILLHAGQHAVFLSCAALALAWLIIASPMQMPALRRH